MSKSTMFIGAALAAITVTSLASPAYAWHPKGEIKKYVQNVSSNGQMVDANTAATSIGAKPGDVLKYTIVVKNTAAPAEKQYNDLSFIKVTDQLPAGVELVSNPASRMFSKDYGTQVVAPGKEVRVDFNVTVTRTVKDKQLIDNKACFTGDSVVKDNKQQGCDNAMVTTTVPKDDVPVTPIEPTPEIPASPIVEVPAELPRTGSTSLVAGGLAVLTFLAAGIIQRRSM